MLVREIEGEPIG